MLFWMQGPQGFVVDGLSSQEQPGSPSGWMERVVVGADVHNLLRTIGIVSILAILIIFGIVAVGPSDRGPVLSKQGASTDASTSLGTTPEWDGVTPKTEAVGVDNVSRSLDAHHSAMRSGAFTVSIRSENAHGEFVTRSRWRQSRQRITTTRTAPAGAPDPDLGQTGDTIGYVEATVSGEGVTESDVASSAFTFRVSQQRLDRAGISPENVRLYRIEDGTPNALETEHLGNNRFRSVAPGFSVFVIGTTSAEFTFTSGQLDRTSISVGETFTATVQVQNDGGASGETTLTLEADGDILTSESITLDSGESTEVDLSASIDGAGTYDITVNGNAIGTLEVTEEGAAPPEDTPTATPEGPDEGTPAAGTPTPTEAPGAFGPGFGMIVALLALLGASLIAIRRRQ